jgi:photosystem II stability/assembly factor-like uncharacterized protein
MTRAQSHSAGRRIVLALALAIATAGLFLEPHGSIGRLSPPSQRGPAKIPNDWFVLQRAYPGTEIPRAAQLRGFAQAQALRTASLAAQGEGAGVWNAAGPTNIGGRITAIARPRTDPLRIYIGAADGGVLRSDNGGGSWTALFDNQPSLSIGALAIHPNNPDILYVGTGEANASGDSYDGDGIYRTTDGGSSWEHLGLVETRRIGRIAIDPLHPDTLYVAAAGALFSTNPERGIYRSVDGGQTFELKHSLNDSTAAIDVTVNPQNPNIVYAAMWERIRRPHVRRVGGPSSGIWRSTNAGETWSLLQNGLPLPGPTVGRIGLAVAASNPQIVYAIYANDPGFFAGVFKSTNGGDTWVRVTDGALSNLYSSFGWYFGNIRVDPQDANRVYVLGVPLYRSTNGGSNWSNVTGSMHVDQHDLFIDPANSNSLIGGGDGGAYFTVAGPGSWVKSFDLPITQFYAITADYQFPQRLYGGTQDNSTMRTMTGNNDDYDIIWGGDGFYTVVDPTNNNFIYAESQNGGLVRSTDGGNNFVDAVTGIPSGDRRNWSTPIVIDPTTPATLYTGTFRVFKSVNRAVSWTPISPDLTNGPGNGNLTFGTVTTLAVAPTQPSCILAGTDDSNVWITTNGGTLWTNVSGSLPGHWCTRVAFDPASAAVGYVTFSGYREDLYTPHVFRTTNFGQTWTDISGNLPEIPVNVLVVDPDDTQTLYVGNDAGVYVTHNLGGTWAALGSGMPNTVVSDLYLHDPTRKLVAGTHGRSMFTYDLNQQTGVAEGESAPGAIAELISASPNPFTTRTTLDVRLTAGGTARLTIHDATGRAIATLVDGPLAAGRHPVGWDGRTASGEPAAAGVYFARLNTRNHVSVQKLVRLP